MGIVTLSLIVGGTIYFIKKAKDAKDMEESEITLEEAKQLAEIRRKQAREATEFVEDIVENYREEDDEDLQAHSDLIEDLRDEARDEVEWNASFGVQNYKEGETYDFYSDLSYTEPLANYIKEEDKALRFEHNSIQARDQFIKMELAELYPSQREYQIMRKLFEVPFEPLTDGDHILHSQLVDHRIEFFGNKSDWVFAITMGDIITHYARLTDFELGNGVSEWIIFFLNNTEFNEMEHASVMNGICVALNQHKYFCNPTRTYGLFGLTDDDMADAQEMADSMIDGEITYEIEFNTFIKTQV